MKCYVAFAFFLLIGDVFGGILFERMQKDGEIPNDIKIEDVMMDTRDSKKDVFEEGEPLNELDFINGNKLDVEGSTLTLYTMKEDPILKAGLFEGDIQDVANISDLLLDGRNAILDDYLRWPDGVIPYAISNDFNSYERSVIARAMTDYHTYTCIRFTPRVNHHDYIYIMKGTGCSSSVGRQGGGQRVSLGNGCVFHGIVVHELMHAAGFWHEQSRADRDDHITILWQNILRGMEYNFQRYSWKYIQNLEESYDLGSVMHYDAYAFTAKRGQPTIISKDKTRSKLMGQRRGFSAVDIRKINKLYQCGDEAGHGSGVTTTTTPTVVPGKGSKPDKLVCADRNSQCEFWAQRGECNKNPIWMKPNCMKSCGQCGRSSCKDHNSKCEFWAQTSECQKNPNYMLHFCKKSCEVC